MTVPETPDQNQPLDLRKQPKDRQWKVEDTQDIPHHAKAWAGIAGPFAWWVFSLNAAVLGIPLLVLSASLLAFWRVPQLHPSGAGGDLNALAEVWKQSSEAWKLRADALLDWAK